MIDLKKIDLHKLKRYLGPGSAADLNRFLEKLPQNSGKSVLIAAGIAWGVASAMGLFTAVQLQSLTKMRTELQEAKALQPPVPKIQESPVDSKELERFATKIKTIYKNLEVKNNGSTLVITAKSSSSFDEFRQALGHVQSGGEGWRVNVDRLCVGRECQSFQLAASLKINKVSVTMPK